MATTFLNLSKPLFLLCFLLFCCADDEMTKKDIVWWCRTTPHPETCSYFMGQQDQGPVPIPKSREDFRTMTIRTALDRAVESQTESNRLAGNCRSKRKRIVFRDCNSLIDSTIDQLNSTLQSILTNATFTVVDAQTWLSSALTNIQICRRGSLDLNLTKFTSPILSANVSELISNCLATNGALLDAGNSSVAGDGDGDGDGFPNWLPPRERKLLQDQSLARAAIAVVSKTGRGNFRSIQAAINYAVSRRVGNTGRVVVYVKKGVYRENVLVSRTMGNVVLVGDGMRSTVITAGRSVNAGFTTYSTATFGVDGIGFMARGITFRNTAGPQGGQAVALRSASDLSVFYGCGFEGYQDTLFVHAQRQFFKACVIYGTIDFIFGNAAVVFQNCNIYVRRPLLGQGNVITAQGRGDPFQNTGISIHKSRIMPAPDLKPVLASFNTYLGRPWQQYSRTVIMKSFIDGFVSRDGWSRWGNSNFALATLYYGEYRNFGPGGSTRSRVKWPGYHVITDPKVASRFTVDSLIAGRAWLPSSGVPFTAGL
ncbi:probable pectinesterase/pectinesterase inhibitor 59 [Andrographis paniculata]|uniref:probable pectinesterase/pectinesterase inhibitor 59 n=1 Tax=Andrographis paniculata TaxID=175694 RepID=UPI0021E907EF|nr:probable pectinesterase/pectinesterase inhibitor 59 [Andrographis paniculata]